MPFWEIEEGIKNRNPTEKIGLVRVARGDIPNSILLDYLRGVKVDYYTKFSENSTLI